MISAFFIWQGKAVKNQEEFITNNKAGTYWVYIKTSKL